MSMILQWQMMKNINYMAEAEITSWASHDICSSLEQRSPDLESQDLDVGFSSDTGIFQNLRCVTWKKESKDSPSAIVHESNRVER